MPSSHSGRDRIRTGQRTWAHCGNSEPSLALLLLAQVNRGRLSGSASSCACIAVYLQEFPEYFLFLVYNISLALSASSKTGQSQPKKQTEKKQKKRGLNGVMKLSGRTPSFRDLMRHPLSLSWCTYIVYKCSTRYFTSIVIIITSYNYIHILLDLRLEICLT